MRSRDNHPHRPVSGWRPVVMIPSRILASHGAPLSRLSCVRADHQLMVADVHTPGSRAPDVMVVMCCPRV